MDEMIANATEAAQLMKVLSNPHRLLVLCALREGERSVGELQARLGTGQVATSQQLMRLRAEGLVSARRDGNQMFYSIARREIVALLSALPKVLCGNVEAAERAAELLDAVE